MPSRQPEHRPQHVVQRLLEVAKSSASVGRFTEGLSLAPDCSQIVKGLVESSQVQRVHCKVAQEYVRFFLADAKQKQSPVLTDDQWQEICRLAGERRGVELLDRASHLLGLNLKADESGQVHIRDDGVECLAMIGRRVASSVKELESLHWELVRHFLSIRANQLAEIADRLTRREPVLDHEGQLLAVYVQHGRVVVDAKLSPVGKWTFATSFQPEFEYFSPGQVHQDQVALLLASPTAYLLVKELERQFESRGKKMYIRQCRSPMCGKCFYTARRNAVACRRDSKQDETVSGCKIIWDAYRQALAKWGKKPEQAWPDPELQARFREQYQPRGSQRGSIDGGFAT